MYRLMCHVFTKLVAHHLFVSILIFPSTCINLVVIITKNKTKKKNRKNVNSYSIYMCVFLFDYFTDSHI